MTKDENIRCYLDMMLHELEKMNKGFTGNVDFKLNFKEGMIANANIVLTKSYKAQE
jgi:hypothetical protein